MNPDGYDYTFSRKATRLWRKNLRDVDGDGRSSRRRRRPQPQLAEKWNYDLEGSSDTTVERDVPRPVAGLRARGVRPSAR